MPRVPPAQTVELLRGLNWYLADDYHFYELAKYLEGGTDDGPTSMRKSAMKGVLLVFDPDGLSALGESDSTAKLRTEKVAWITLRDEDHCWDIFQAGSRFCSVNVTRVLIDAVLALEKVGGPDRRKFGEGLLDWLESVEREHYSHD